VKEYSDTIELTRNRRGCFVLDPVLGCVGSLQNGGKGCYGDCYAAKYSKRYGYNFNKIQLRNFENDIHLKSTINKINKIDMSFVRMGSSGDPSCDWEHSMEIIKAISDCNKEIVIITKHWELLTNNQLEYLSSLNICINTSISALDNKALLGRRLNEYIRIKPYCKSILRVVSCDFNLEHPLGLIFADVQHDLFKNEHTIDTVFRPSKNNIYVLDGIINIEKDLFMGKKCYVSKYNKQAYLGYCDSCHEECGVIETDEEYFEIIKARFHDASKQYRLEL
jgi:hypothetical protein